MVFKQRIPPESRSFYERLMRFYEVFSENAAPELFKWIGWVVVLAAVEVVRRNTHANWLFALEAVMAFTIYHRMVWRFFPHRFPETEMPDGALLVTFTGLKWRLIAGTACWLLAILLTIGLAGAIADSELLPEAVQKR